MAATINTTLLVSEEKIKLYTSINQNVSPLDIKPYIYQGQELYLMNYLGTSFYRELQKQVFDGTVNEANAYLLDNFLGQACIQAGLVVGLPYLKYKIFNKSILSPNSESADSISLEELQFLQSQARDAFQTYMNYVIRYMTLHPGDYPLYIAPNTLLEKLPEYGSPFQAGLTIPKYPYAYKQRWNQSAWGWSWDTQCCEGLVPNSVPRTNQ
jgi:hypothetical protein